MEGGHRGSTKSGCATACLQIQPSQCQNSPETEEPGPCLRLPTGTRNIPFASASPDLGRLLKRRICIFRSAHYLSNFSSSCIMMPKPKKAGCPAPTPPAPVPTRPSRLSSACHSVINGTWLGQHDHSACVLSDGHTGAVCAMVLRREAQGEGQGYYLIQKHCGHPVRGKHEYLKIEVWPTSSHISHALQHYPIASWCGRWSRLCR